VVQYHLSTTAKSREKMFAGHITNNAFFFSEKFSGRELHQDVTIFQHFRDWPRPHLLAVAGGLVE